MSETSEKRKTEIGKEIERWNGFARVLRTTDKEAFDQLMDRYRRLGSEATDGSGLSGFEEMMLSITTGLVAELAELEKRINHLYPMKPKPQPEKAMQKANEPMICYVKPPAKKGQRELLDFS
jgi:hypothetical protein